MLAFRCAFDMCDEDAVGKGVTRIEQAFRRVAVLINNAGIHQRSLLADMPLEAWRNVIDTNLTAAFLVSKAVTKMMIERHRWKIVYITSLMAEGARPSTGDYCVSKGGLKMLTKVMVAELGRHNIQVNSVGPGYFKTELNSNPVADPEFDAWVREKVPLRQPR